jgi:hypothetical protein
LDEEQKAGNNPGKKESKHEKGALRKRDEKVVTKKKIKELPL